MVIHLYPSDLRHTGISINVTRARGGEPPPLFLPGPPPAARPALREPGSYVDLHKVRVMAAIRFDRLREGSWHVAVEVPFALSRDRDADLRHLHSRAP